MITDDERDNALLRYYQRGILKQEVRSYEVSLWTLLDEFITVLKWSDVEQKGRIEEPKMELDIDGTLNFTFKIPMYIMKWNEHANYSARLEKIENPIWYNTLNGNLIEGMRKIKVIFNKDEINNSVEEIYDNELDTINYVITPNNGEETIFEFIINKITESHELDIATCEVECEGLAFHELGKIGYKLHLSQEDFELVYKEWVENGYWTKKDLTLCLTLPIQNLQYWCEECAGLVPWPGDSLADSRTWYYYIDMDWSSFAFSERIGRSPHTVYEEAFTTAWNNDLSPKSVEQYKEKARPVEANLSNLYNITQTIAEQFGVHCRYLYNHNNNLQITSKVVIFYNNYNREQEGILEFSYPYSSKKVTRNVDVTDLTTKLFISPIDSDNSLEGTITIMNSPANKLKEDYILNFDYIHKIKGITDELYDAITQFEKDIRAKNEELIPAQLELEAFENKKIEVEAKYTTYNNSIDLDNELITYNTGLENALDALDGDNDGYISLYDTLPNKTSHPDTAIIITPEGSKAYVNLEYSLKGIDVNTLHVYRNWAAGTGTCSNEITGFKAIYDEKYNNLIKLENILPDNNGSKTVYLTYKYKPLLYYENIIKTWQTKLATDIENRDKCEEELSDLEDYISNAEATIKRLCLEKEEILTEFEHMMGPALREGYWNPENYNDYGDVKVATLLFPSTATPNPFTRLTDNDVVVGWDDLLFDAEEKIYYNVGINETKYYYPCINLSSIFEENINNICEHINEYSFIFNNNYEDHSADLTNIRYIRSFSVGSEALLRFVKNRAGTVFPILVLIGAKTMTNDEITFMKRKTTTTNGTTTYGGNPRLGIINSTIESNTVSTVINSIIEVDDSSYWTFGGNNINQCTEVYPRINFNNISVKTDNTNLYIAYNNILLTAYTDYLVTTRTTHYGTTQNPIDHIEYYINLKPEVMWKCGTYTGDVKINYIVSNLATSIYIDALEIAQKNSEPKVEYNLEANIVNENILHSLYNDLGRIIMITDIDLKLEEAFGYISHIELDLDKPEEDTIEIKNYKTKFEDLFSKIVASTEAILKNSDGISSALGGNIGLSPVGFSSMLSNNDAELKKYLDDYFTTSHTVEETLSSLFNEAGMILGSSNKILNNTIALTTENASILSGFASLVILELSPKVIRSPEKPVDFQVGDIWIETEAIPNTNPTRYREIGRYVATSDSLHSVGDYGFTRTYDGSLALITGESLNIDAENGLLSIKASKRLELLSAGDIYLGANNKVDIVGNTAVNIGGTLINLASTTVDNSPVESGINIVSAQYDSLDSANISKVSIKPKEIYMAGSKITMLTGTANNSVSAILLDGAKGVYIGSDKEIRLLTNTLSYNSNGDLTTSGAVVKIASTLIFMGVTSGTASSLVDIEPGYIVMSTGTLSNVTTSDVTVAATNSLTGLKLTSTSFGLAVGSGATRAVMLMNNNGIIVGTGENPLGNNVGSYVSIAGTGVTIGSSANLTINATNFVILSDVMSANADTFRLGTDANPVLRYRNGNLSLSANGAFTIGSGSSLTVNGGSIDVTSSGSINVNSNGTLNVSTANLVINTAAGNGLSIFKLSDGAATNPVNYINIAKNSSGILTAQLGGWLIAEKKLYSGTSSNYVALDANSSDSYAVWCGAETDTSAPFAVTRGGDVFLNSLLVLDNEHKINPNATQVTRGSDKYSKVEFSKLNFDLAIALSLQCSGITITSKGVFLGTWTKTMTTSATASLKSVDAGSASISWGVGSTTITVDISNGGSLEFENVIIDARAIANNAASRVMTAANTAEAACEYNGGNVLTCYNGIVNTAEGIYTPRDYLTRTITAGVSMYRSGRSVYAKGIAKISGNSVDETSYQSITVPEDTPSGGGCFAAGSLVTLADGSVIPIEKLGLGMKVLAYDEENKKFVPTEIEILLVIKNRTQRIIELQLSSGKNIMVTAEHPFLTSKGWSAVDLDTAIIIYGVGERILQERDKLISLDGDVYIEKIIEHPELSNITVYHMDVEPFDTYIVEGVIVHNDDSLLPK